MYQKLSEIPILVILIICAPRASNAKDQTAGSVQACFSATWGTVKPFNKSVFRTLLGKLNSIVTSKIRASKVSKEAESLLRKFAQQVEKIFKNLSKPLE